MQLQNRRLRVLFLRERPLKRGPKCKLVPDETADHIWAAVCLDHFIVGTGKTLEEAKRAFEEAVFAEFEVALDACREPLSDLAPAPDPYQAMWEAAQRTVATVTLTIQRPEGVRGEAILRRVPIAAESRIAQ